MPVWLGPITMYRMGRSGESIVKLSKLAISHEVKLVFSFGEIDARQHIVAQAENQGRSYQSISKELR